MPILQRAAPSHCSLPRYGDDGVMILRCPGCNGTHLEFEMSDPQIRRCLECGIYFIAEEDYWQVEPLIYDPKWLEEQKEAA